MFPPARGGRAAAFCGNAARMHRPQNVRGIIPPVFTYLAARALCQSRQARKGGMSMKGDPEQRAIALGKYIAAHKATVRAAAAAYHISKSTVHTEVT